MSENALTMTQEIRDDLDGRFLLFNIEDDLYSIMLRYVIEIIPIQNITYLPNVASYIKGIVNLRGKIVPVISVRAKLDFLERDYDDKTCIIVVETHDMHIGLIVDSISEVVTVDSGHMAAPPTLGDSAARYLASVSEVDGKVVLNLDCEKFLHDDLSDYA